jgi:hypothetical protein
MAEETRTMDLFFFWSSIPIAFPCSTVEGL